MDSESERTRQLGCWNGFEALAGTIAEWTSNSATHDFKPSEDYCNFLVDTGFGPKTDPETRKLWKEIIQSNYTGDSGRRRARMAAINLRERDGLHSRLYDVRCPVLWLHGTEDQVYSVANAEEEIKMFVNSPEARLKVVEGGQHFLSFSHPKEVDEAVAGFVEKYGR